MRADIAANMQKRTVIQHEQSRHVAHLTEVKGPVGRLYWSNLDLDLRWRGLAGWDCLCIGWILISVVLYLAQVGDLTINIQSK